jgi:hypothetical protein
MRETGTGWLLWWTDRLFGADEARSEPVRRWLVRYLVVAALLAAIIVVRRRDAVTNPQFWAEDSVIYFWENLRLGFRGALANYYNNYPMLAQRLVAGVGGLVPLAYAPRVYTTSAIGITAFALATFALPGFRHLVRSDALRVLWCIAVVSLRVDWEMLSTPTNLGWYLAIWLALLSVMRAPRTWRCIVALWVAAAVSVFTNPLALITGPIWLLRAWHATVRRLWRELGLSLAQLGLLVWVVLLTRDLGLASATVYWPGGVTSSLLSDRIGVLRGWLALAADRATALVLPPTALAVKLATRAATSGLAALIAAAALGACWSGGFATLPAVLLATYYATGSLLLEIIGRPTLLFLAPSPIPVRYTIFPAAMFVLGLVAAADALSSRRARTIAVGTLSVVFAWAWWSAFVVPPFTDQDWPTWAARLEGKLALQTHESLEIPVNPRWSPLRIDVRTMSTEISVPPSEILAGLGSHGKFWQSFISRCEGLSEVDFWLGSTAPTTQGDLQLSVTDVARTVVASVRLSRAELVERAWQRFYFAPVAGSAGRRYLVQLTAVDNDPDATIFVMGSKGDPYPDGDAFYLGKRIEADASIRYGCTVPSTALPLAPGSPAIPPGPKPEHSIGRH